MDVFNIKVNGEWVSIPAIKGNSGVYVGSEEPTDPDVNVWIDTSEGATQNATTTAAGLMSAEDKIKIDDMAHATDTVLNTTLSHGRKTDTTVGISSIAFGGSVEASGMNSVATGARTTASGSMSFAACYDNISSGTASFTEGSNNIASAQCAHAEGKYTKATQSFSHAEGYNTQAVSGSSHAEGEYVIASGINNHAQGRYNAYNTHAGWPEWVSGTTYHIGDKVKITTIAEDETITYPGYICKTENSDIEFNAEKWNNDTNFDYADIVGNGTSEQNRSNAYALGWNGDGHYAGDVYVHANADSSGGDKLLTAADMPVESGTGVGSIKVKDYIDNDTNFRSTASARGSVAVGGSNTASAYYTFAEGYKNEASGSCAHVEGQNSKSTGTRSHAEGYATIASGNAAHAEGSTTKAIGSYAHAEGYYSGAYGARSHAEGLLNFALGNGAHAEGTYTTATQTASHAEGIGGGGNTIKITGDANATQYTCTSGINIAKIGAIIIGRDTYAKIVDINIENSILTLSNTLGESYNNESCYISTSFSNGCASHTEGNYTTANGFATHAQGSYNVPDEILLEDWVSGYSYAVGDCVNYGGTGYRCLTSNSDQTFTSANWTKIPFTSDTAFVIGNGTSYTEKSNAAKIDWQGNAKYAGDVYVHSNPDSSGGIKLATVEHIPSQVLSGEKSTDNTPYLLRKTPDGVIVEDTIVGATVGWNQLIDPTYVFATSGTITKSNGVYSVAPSGSYSSTLHYGITLNPISMISGHVYLLTVKVCGTKADKFRARFSDATKYSSDLSANETGKIEILAKAATNLNVLTVYAYDDTLYSSSDTLTFSDFCFYDITTLFGSSTIADYVYTLESNTDGAGIAKLREWGFFTKPYYAYDSGSLKSVQVSAHKTTGFNQWDEETETGAIHGDTGALVVASTFFRSKNYIPIMPNTTYYSKMPVRAVYGRIYQYDKNKNFLRYDGTAGLINDTFTTLPNAYYMKLAFDKNAYGETYQHDVCINLSDPVRNGEYESYVSHTYALDDSKEFRGVFRLDANNNLYADGDEYPPSGEEKVRYGIVDLGTLNWAYDSLQRFTAEISDMKSSTTDISGGLITPFYLANGNPVSSQNQDKTLGRYANKIYILDSAYNNAQTYKNAVSGQYLIYELATPTTSTADPFETNQICDPSGTEEYIPAGENIAVPVGHKTTYYQGLRSYVDKDGVKDVQTNGISILNNGIANIPVASTNTFGVIKANSYYGAYVDTGILLINASDTGRVKMGADMYRPIVPNTQHVSTFYGLAKAAGDSTQSASDNAVGTYTPAAKAAIRSMLGIEADTSFIENISGSTPTITGEPNCRYICGEVSSISITPPAAGSIDVIFTSGSTAALLTLPNTVKLPGWFDATSLDTNTIYEINILNGTYGTVMAWDA